MDFNFNCPFCNLALTIDETGAGSEIACPGCKEVLIIPSPEESGGYVAPAEEGAGSLTIPLPHASTEAKIVKPNKALDVAAKTLKKARLKTFRHAECVKDGKDHFDETVSEFLQKTGDDNVVSVHPVQYSHTPKDATQSQTDYGVVIVYKA